MSETKNIISAAFERMEARYASIFNAYYPAHNSTGFTERNLSCNFVAALESLHPPGSLISWYEAPVQKPSKGHIDAVCFSRENRTSFFIESKRFSSVKGKKEEATLDIKRLLLEENRKLLEYSLRWEKTNRVRWAIVLADVWVKKPKKQGTSAKQRIYDSWGANDLEQLDLHKDAHLYPDTISLKSVGIERHENWHPDYRLLLLGIKLPES